MWAVTNRAWTCRSANPGEKLASARGDVFHAGQRIEQDIAYMEGYPQRSDRLQIAAEFIEVETFTE